MYGEVITQQEYDINKFNAHLWAKSLLEKDNWVILHLAATGKYQEDRITEICILSRHGSIMFESLVNPDMFIDPTVEMITGIDNSMTDTAPYFVDIYPKLRSLLQGKTIVNYCADFNISKIVNEELINDLDGLILNEISPRKHWLSLDEPYSHWQNSFYAEKEEYFIPSLYLFQQQRRAKTAALNIYNRIKQMAKPLSCEILIPDQSFIKQLYLDWSNEKKINFTIKLPRFYFSHTRKSNFKQ